MSLPLPRPKDPDTEDKVCASFPAPNQCLHPLAWRQACRGAYKSPADGAVQSIKRSGASLFLSLAPFYCLSVSVVTLSLSLPLMGAVELQLITDVNGPEE